VTTSSPAETEQLGAALARHLEAGDVVGVRGELGAGKTAFIRGACRALAVKGRVTSPTFSIGHRYAGDPDVAHLDLYRFESMAPAEWGDIEPLLEGAITFVEWPDVGTAFLPAPRVSIELRHVDEAHREIELTTTDAALLAALESAQCTDSLTG